MAWPSGTIAIRGRSTKNSRTPPSAPGTVATSASTAASRVTCAGVAPARRSAASRCSRRAADSRVALATNTATGASAPTSAMTTRIRIRGFVGTGMGRVPLSSVTTRAPSARSDSASRPTTAASSSGAISPAGSMVPTTSPNRSPSSSAGVVTRRSARAGDTNVSPAAGTRGRPGGTGASSASAATSIRTRRRPCQWSSVRASIRPSVAVARSSSPGVSRQAAWL